MVLVLATVPVSAEGGAALPGLGMNQGSAAALKDAGAPPAYGSFWVGEWMERSGWGGLENTLRGSLNVGNTPVVYWYYWGDSISRSCIEYGCDGRDKAEWIAMTATLAEKVRSIMGGKTVIVVLENEFNKGGITDTSYAPTFDGYLVERIKQLHAVPGIHVNLGFGSWGEDAWSRFPGALAASDSIGFQMMRAQTRDSEASYRGAPDRIASTLAHIQKISGKPSLLYDLALSSYPDNSWERIQAETLDAILDRRAEYGESGLIGIVYRELKDNPSMGSHNYFGYAEQHWGLKRTDGTMKLAWTPWLEAHGTTPPPPPPTNVPGLFEAEAMTATTGGRQADSTASGGALWNVWTNGHVSQQLTSDGGEFRLVVIARGSPAAGVDARMDVRLNGASVGAFTVPRGLSQFAIDVALPAGTSTLAVAFTNDALVNGEDRNLLVDAVRVDAKTANRAPSAAFGWSANGLTASFDGAASADADGDALSYAWSFGNGATATGAKATTTYANGGSYVVTLTVSDGKASSTATQTIAVARPNQAPAASFVTSGKDLGWSFDASGSSDPDGQPLNYAWSFGDGRTATGAKVSNAYAAPGSYTVRLVVSDGALSSESSATVVATQPNRAPVAAFSVSGKDLVWSFDASASSDPDGDPLTYLWDLGDGKTASGVRVSHAYASAGDRTVKLTVLDGRGLSGETRSIAMARDPPAPPAATAHEAEHFAVRDNGAAFGDHEASGASAWLLWSNGALKQRFAPGYGSFNVEVVAKGDYAGAWPTMELRADGVLLAKWVVASAKWTTYRVPISFADGEVRELSVAFTNDHLGSDGDRNLRLDVLRIAPPTRVVEAESFATKGPGIVYADSVASGAKAFLLWSNGAISTPVSASPGKYVVQIVAKADYAKGWPIMELRADGVTIAKWNVSSTSWSAYSAPITMGTAAKTLSVHFVNDYRDATSDRNLRLDAVRLLP